jgi:hypothetical protein
VLDVVRAVAVVVAIACAARQRFVLGVACGAASAYVLAASAAAVAAAVARGGVVGEWAFALLFLGPSAVPFAGGAPLLPASHWIATHTLASLAGSAALAAAPVAWAWARSAALSPHAPESRRWDAIASAFLLLAVVALVRLVAGALFAWSLARQTEP